MPCDVIDVKGYADLASEAKLHDRDPDVVARELQEHGHKDDWLICWVPEWIFDEKDVEPVDDSQQILSGRIEAETDKAFLLAMGREDAWVPKSVIRVYEAEAPSEITVPQHGISDFTEGSA